ncbi:hypothetical protein DFH08DRAFT_803957 [Mycena albidolilacea]|uniref:Uncharacterized protein n=1 Tax=Mycena albidolilacea TaxID=1033008 RepID=A0AAD7EWL4_9AGAR|nr:hypothetical protein DFH08DRAFT_803957 [Mycena albidolilacea]
MLQSLLQWTCSISVGAPHPKKLPHVELVPVSYTLSNSNNKEEEADRKVEDVEEAVGDESGSESGTLRPGSSSRPTLKTQPAPSSPTKSEGTSTSASASKSNPGGTIHVKKEGASSSKTLVTFAAQNHLLPKATHCSAHPPTPPAKDLFADEVHTSSSTNHLVYSLSSQGRPPSVDVAELEKLPAKRGRAHLLQPSRKSAKTRADSNPPTGEKDKPNPRHINAPLSLEIVPHAPVVELTTPMLPHRCTIACATCIACGKTYTCDGFGTPCGHCLNGNQACSFKRSPVEFHRTLEFLRPLVNLSGGALNSVVLSAVQARRDLNEHFLWLARAANNYDRLCTEVVVL